MEISRRRALGSVPLLALAGSGILSRAAARAQDDATPEASPDVPIEDGVAVSCEELVGTPVPSEAGEALLGRLLRTPVTTPLFPADTGRVFAEPWVDECDTDLAGTVGGVLMQTGTDELDNFIGPGVYIVFADEAAAQARLDEQIAEAEADVEGVRTEITPVDVTGYGGVTIGEPDSTVTIVVVGLVLVGGISASDPPGDPAFRSLANCLALLDHLRSVTA